MNRIFFYIYFLQSKSITRYASFRTNDILYYAVIFFTVGHRQGLMRNEKSPA